MCKYEMDPASIVEDTERTRFVLQTDRPTDKVKPVYPLPLNFVAGGIKNHGMSGHQLEHWRIDGPTTKENLVTLLQGYNWYKMHG